VFGQKTDLIRKSDEKVYFSLFIDNIKYGRYSQTPKTIFKWGPMESAKKIKESFKNIVEECYGIQKNGDLWFVSVTNCGVIVKNIIDKNRSLVTSFVIKEIPNLIK